MKRYVCSNCLGFGKVNELIYEGHGNVGERGEDCPFCVARGAPPFIDIPHGTNQMTVEVLPEKRLEP